MASPAPAVPSKLCSVCKEDVASKPRVKDETGRYYCKPCHEGVVKQAEAAKLGAKVAPKPVAKAPAPVAAVTAGWGEDDDLASIQQAASHAPAMSIQSCPGCGTPMGADSVVCTHCGFNRATGKRGRKVKVSKEGEGLDKEKVANALWYANPLAWLAAAAVGGLISAALWGMIAAGIKFELGYMALGVGALCGGCVVFVAKGYACWVSGLMAAAAAIGGILGGMYWARYSVADAEVKKIVSGIVIDDEAAQNFLTRDVTKEMMASGATLTWPSGVYPDPQAVEEPEDFPKEARAAATARWDKADTAWRDRYREQVKTSLRDEISSEAASSSMWDRSSGTGYRAGRGFFMGIVLRIVGVVIAFTIGAGMGVPWGD